MQTWTFPALIKKDGEGGYCVTFPDIPGCITGGFSLEEARLNAEDALEEMILFFMAHGMDIPAPRAAESGEEAIALDPVTASRAILARAMKAGKVSNVALAAKLGKTEGAIRRLTDGSSAVKLDTVLQAMRAVGINAALAVVA